ncbi:MAG TPA: hypothetical protein VF620_16565 [Allosphingosinicella sp.]|jgi:opacity protein-like surface antigen
MKMAMIAALAAAHLSAAAEPARAAEPPSGEAAAGQTRFDEGKAGLEDGHAPVARRVAAAQEDEPRKKKRKSTVDKVLTGAAVILGVGALAVGGLLVAIFVN